MFNKLRQNKRFRVFTWQLLSTITGSLAGYLVTLTNLPNELGYVVSSILIPTLLMLSKMANESAGDIGVINEK